MEGQYGCLLIVNRRITWWQRREATSSDLVINCAVVVKENGSHYILCQ